MNDSVLKDSLGEMDEELNFSIFALIKLPPKCIFPILNPKVNRAEPIKTDEYFSLLQKVDLHLKNAKNKNYKETMLRKLQKLVDDNS